MAKLNVFTGQLPKECLNIKSMIDLQDARGQISQYIEFYNTKRPHSSLFYLTPQDFLLGRVEEKLRIREEKLQRAIQARTIERLVS